VSICQLINSTITKIKEYPIDVNNLSPDEYQQHLEELPKQVEKLGNIKKLLEAQKGFGVVDKYLTANNLKPSGVEEILDIVTVNRQEDITDVTLIFDGDLDLSDITESIDANEILGNIQTVTGNLYLWDLESAEGLVLPSSLGGGLDLSNLKSAKGLVLPSSVGGYLNLVSLTSAEVLVLPSNVGGSLNLRSLTSLDGLKLPSGYHGPLCLSENLRSIAERDPRFAGVTIR